jgi:hypothetical protein
MLPESTRPESPQIQKGVNLLLQVQTAMLVATKKLALGENAFALWQMYTAMRAAHHILAFDGRRLFMSLFLPLF